MIGFADLTKHDPSLKLLWGDSNHIRIESIATADNLDSHTFVFVKDLKFYKKIKWDKIDFSRKSHLGVVLENSFLQTPEAKDCVDKLAEYFSFGASVNSVAEALCLLSKPFYDKLFSDLNYYVDGRQLGNVDISPMADIAQNVFIGEGAKIHANVKIMPGCVVMPMCEIGEGTILFPNVTLYPYTKIGNECRIHSSTVIGADGFGYTYFNKGHQKIWHFSGVNIGHRVEIGVNTCVDAGAFIPTTIGDGTKIDDLVLVGHNVQVGKDCILCGLIGMGGSSKLGNLCVLAGGAGIGPGAVLGNGIQVAARTTVSENAIWEDGLVLGGTPAAPLKEWMHFQAKLRHLAKK